MNGILLDPKTGRPESDEPEFEIGDIFKRPNGWTVVDFLKKRPEASQALEDLEKGLRFPEIRGLTRNKSYIGGRSTATAATARNVATGIWNPHATSRIQLFEVWSAATTAGATNLGLARTTARGTASTTVAVAIANSILNDTAAPSGFSLDLAYSVQPTVSAANLAVFIIQATIGAGVILSFPDPIDITPGSGIALITTQAAAYPVSDITFCVGD